MNLMVINDGALGDTIWSIPALNVLREEYDAIYMSCRPQGKMVLSDTGLIDGFVVKPDGFELLEQNEKRDILISQSRDMEIDAITRVIPGAYMWHPGEYAFTAPATWRRGRNEGVNYFDAVSMRMRVAGQRKLIDSWYSYKPIEEMVCIRNGVPEAVGMRPYTRISENERKWLNAFRYKYNIPQNALLLQWQFMGSAVIKQYPYFDTVIQKGIMEKYNVYVVCTGDMNNEFNWEKSLHGGRYINMGNSISFRQAWLLTSIVDCLVSPETGIFSGAQAFKNTSKILLATHTAGYHVCCGDENIILTSNCSCSPCYQIRSECKKDGRNKWSLCMGSIEPERVIKAIESVLGERHG